MTQTDFTDNVVITGSRDIDQLKVKANATQAQPLQTWENSAGNVLSQVTGDGRLQVGDDVGLSSPDALVEAHRAETSTAKPKRGWHSLGKVTNLVSDLITWTMSELLLLGSAGVSGLQTAFRAKLTHNNTGTSTSAELRAGDFQSINQTGSSGTRVGQVTGVRGTGSNDVNAYVAKAIGVESTITNASGGDVTDAVGFEVVAPTNSGTIANLHGLRIPDLTAGAVNYAIKTGLGNVSFGDFLEVKRPGSVPSTPATDFMRVYPKSDARLYGKNSSGIEVPLSNSAVLLYDNTLAADGNWDVDLSTLPDGLNYLHLELIVLARTNVSALVQWINMLFNNDATLTNYKASMVFNNFGYGPASSVSSNPYVTPVPGATAPTNSFGISRIFIPFYRLTTALHSNPFSNSYKLDTTDGLITLIGTHHWINTAAINRIQIKADNDPTNKIVTNSRLQIIGYRF